MKERRNVNILLGFALILVSFQSLGAVWPWRWNQVNKQGDRQGRWRGYYEHKPDQLMLTGRFKKGKERGTWKTYSAEGHLERQERYNPARKSILTTFYHKNGKVSHAGTAYLFEENGYLMYKWHGDWHYYDSTGVSRGWKSFNQGWPSQLNPLCLKILVL